MAACALTYRLSQENECDVYGSMTMSRAAELMNKIGYKYHVDKMRRNNGHQMINYPHPTSAQKEALESYERHHSAGKVGQACTKGGECARRKRRR